MSLYTVWSVPYLFHIYLLYIDDARRTREEWNLRRRVRRAEMSEEQQEEARRKGREYQRQRRERQRAESQNIGATSSLPGTISFQKLFSQSINTSTNHCTMLQVLIMIRPVKTSHFFWTRKMSNQLKMGIISMVLLARQSP